MYPPVGIAPAARPRRISIFGRLMLSHALVIVTCVMLAMIVASFVYNRFLLNNKELALLQSAELLAQMVAERAPAPWSELGENAKQELQSRVKHWCYLFTASIWVVGADGAILVGSAPQAPLPGDRRRFGPQPVSWEITPEELTVVGDTMPQALPPTVSGSQMVLGVYAPIIAGNAYLGGVFVRAPLANVLATVRGWQQSLLVAAAAALSLALLVSYVVANLAANPLRQMCDAARQMAQGDFGQRVTPRGTQEVAELAETLNWLAASLEGTLLALQQEKDRFALVIQGMSEAVIAIDTQGRLIITNPAAELLLAESPGATPLAAYPRLSRAMHEAIETGEKGQLLLSPAQNKKMVLSATVAPIRGMGAVAVLHDITESWFYQVLQQEFIANASHELRTPLGLIQGYLEAIQDGYAKDPGQAGRFLQVAHEETIRLQDLVDDLLTLSALQEKRSAGAGVDLCKVTADVIQAMTPAFEKRSVQLILDMPRGHVAAPRVTGHAHLLKQVVINLLDNALRYSPPGSAVRIGMSATEEGIELRVTDQGCGIPPADLPHIFDRFYRVEKARGRDSGGTGLGLAIVKSVVESYGGHATATSRPGEGSTFVVRLPSHTAPKGSGKSVPPGQHSPLAAQAK